MKKTLILYAGFFVIALAVFVYVGAYGPAWLRQFEDEVLVALITLFGSLLIYVDFRERRSKRSIWKALAALWAVNATLAASLFLVSFTAPGALLIPVFMLEGALLYYWLENLSDAGASASASG
jgi:hypothetical protein